MYRIITIVGLLFFCPIFMAQSCNRTSCKDAICTDMFAMVTVQLQNQQGQSVLVDEVYTIRKKNGEKINPSQNMEEGRYIVLDDNYRKSLENSKDDFQFVGVKDGKVVVDETFQISADCCHINKEIGKEIIVVQ